MNPLPLVCPLCEGTLVVQTIHCRACDTTYNGHFAPAGTPEFEEEKLPILRRFARLSPEQLQLLEAFIRTEGRLNQLSKELGVSYPTVRSRVDEMVSGLGFSPRQPDEEEEKSVDRLKVLADLRAGKLTPDEAARMFSENRG